MEDSLAPIGCNIPLNVVYYMISTFIPKEFRTMSTVVDSQSPPKCRLDFSGPRTYPRRPEIAVNERD